MHLSSHLENGRCKGIYYRRNVENKEQNPHKTTLIAFFGYNTGDGNWRRTERFVSHLIFKTDFKRFTERVYPGLATYVVKRYLGWEKGYSVPRNDFASSINDTLLKRQASSDIVHWIHRGGGHRIPEYSQLANYTSQSLCQCGNSNNAALK